MVECSYHVHVAALRMTTLKAGSRIHLRLSCADDRVAVVVLGPDVQVANSETGKLEHQMMLTETRALWPTQRDRCLHWQERAGLGTNCNS